MIASWMSYAFLVSALVAIAAGVAERLAASRRWPKRVVWAVALTLSIAWPIGSGVRQLLSAQMKPVTVLPFSITVQPSRILTKDPVAPDRAALIDRALLAGWVLLSLLLLLRLIRGVMTLQRTRRGWTRGEIDGTSVRLSDNVGPAVVGLRPMDVVVPEWILTLDSPLRAIVLRHEEEHRAARDPYLLCFAAFGVALMPWNLPLWMQARRLRLAIEMDCDARVLQVHPSPERYGLLMLTIAQRRAVAPTLFAPMLSEPTSQLERRILAMRTTTRRLGRLTMYGGATLALGLLAFACSLTSDNPVRPNGAEASPSARPDGGIAQALSGGLAASGNQPGNATRDGNVAAARVRTLGHPTPVNADQTYFEFQVEKQVTPDPPNVAPRYPDVLRTANVEGEVLVQFVVDTAGRPDMSTFKVLKSTHDLFTNSVKAALPAMRFYPAEVGGKHVKQLVQMPFQFNLSK